MAEVRIIAVSFEGGKQLRHISHVWTAGGATPTRRAVEDLWKKRCSYYTMAPSGRIEVTAVPARAPGLMTALLGREIEIRLESQALVRNADSLLTLPRLPSPNRVRRSQQVAESPDTGPAPA